MKYNVGTMKYFLVGYMACGKTRRGKVIAEEQGVRFIDLDAYIVERENRSISEIFAAIGEAGFRRLETFYLKEVCELYQDFVLSTGGGTPCFNDNMAYMNAQGITLFLNTDTDQSVSAAGFVMTSAKTIFIPAKSGRCRETPISEVSGYLFSKAAV